MYCFKFYFFFVKFFLCNKCLCAVDDCDVVMELGKALMNTGIKLGHGIAVIVDAMLKVSMLKPAQENSIPQQPRPRVCFEYYFFFFSNFITLLKVKKMLDIYQCYCSSLQLPTMTLETLPDYGADDSSTGEYVTADDGYEADTEVPGRSLNSSTFKRNSPLGSSIAEPRGHANAHPALCSLAIDLLIHFSEQ